MEPKGAIRYGRYTDATTGKHGVRISVANQGDVIIEDIKVEFVYDYETPITRELPARAASPSSLRMRAADLVSGWQQMKPKGHFGKANNGSSCSLPMQCPH